MLAQMNVVAKDLFEGADIDMYLTSPTISSRSYRFDDKLYRWALGKEDFIPLSPTAVLDPGDACWAFSGSAGYITIQFPRPSYVQSVAIVHSPRFAKSSPRDIAIWGIIATQLQASSATLGAHKTNIPKALLSGGISLGRFQYDARNDPGNQTFIVDNALVEHKFDKLVFEVVNNWGAEFTCLYGLHAVGF